LHYIKFGNTVAGRDSWSEGFFLADFLDDRGFEFLTVGALYEHFVTIEADENLLTGGELAGDVAS
jgi:hypothetical protein